MMGLGKGNGSLLNMAIFSIYVKFSSSGVGFYNFTIQIHSSNVEIPHQATEVWDNCKSRDQEP